MRKANVQFLMDNYESALATYVEGLKYDPNNIDVIDGLRREIFVQMMICVVNFKGTWKRLQYSRKKPLMSA